MITQKELLVNEENKIIEFNGFKLYRSDNGVATIIEYNWPTADGTLGEKRIIEVIDATYRNTLAYAPSGAYDYENNALTNFDAAGNDGTKYIYNQTNYSRTNAIPINITAFTNTGICSQWRNLSIDKTAKYNTDQWMNHARFNLSGYAPYWTTHLDVDNGEWCIPNEFQLIVMYCCSDKLDELDPTFSSNKDKGLGYKATSGRFSLFGSIWSSTECTRKTVRLVDATGNCGSQTKHVSIGVVPIRELS